MKISVMIFWLFLFLPVCLNAQESLNRDNPLDLFNEAYLLVQNHNYSAARSRFEQFIHEEPTSELKAEAAYYRAYCAMQLFHGDAESLFESFISEYPTHPKAIMAYFELGNFYYRGQKYEKAISSFEKVKMANLSKSQANELKFKLGYSYFNLKKFNQALDNFKYTLQDNNSFQGASAYYASFIALENEQYDDALDYINIAGEYEVYNNVVPFLKTRVYYEKRDYQEVIAYAQPVMRSGDEINESAEIALMLADAYYHTEDYRNAYQYFEINLKQSDSRDNEVLYKAGFTAYQSGYFDDAIDYLKNAALSENDIGQYASYYLGLAYLRTGNKNYAITAFENASRKNFNEEIKHEAMFCLGKLYYDTGKFDEAIRSLTEFQGSGFTAGHQQELNELLSQSYLKTDDVNKAISYIEALPEKTDKVREVYQFVTFKKATEFFNAGQYYNAVQMFERSLTYPMNTETSLSAWFWMGEAYSIGKRYDDAIKSYQKVLQNDPSGKSLTFIKAQYGLGYAYFNTGAYDRALNHFRIYVRQAGSGNQRMFYDDAMLRLADCYYVTKQYNDAIKIYRQAIDMGNTEQDYCFYQIGLIHSFLGHRQDAEQNFNMVLSRFKNSVWYDDALFRKSKVAFESGDYSTAIQRYSQFITELGQSPLIPYALIDRAISYYNLKNYDQCINDYSRVINEFPRHDAANNALLGLQEVLTAANRSDEFTDYLTEYKKANPEDKDLANVEFESAKTLYFNQKYDKAVEALEKYLNEYPGNPFEYDAYYYLGESYYRVNQPEAAIRNFLKVTENSNSPWYSRSVNRVGMLYNSLNDYRKAIQYFRQLKNIASNRREEYDAWSGLMEAYYQAGQYDSVIVYAGNILEKGTFSANAQNRAQLLTGKAYLKKGDTQDATDYFLNTVNTAKDANGAEAQYLIAEILYNQGKYEQSIEALYNLNENFGIYEEWIGKSFLLIAENFVAMDEMFQAKATLNSVIEKSPVDEIVSKAKARLLELEALEDEKSQADTVGMK